METPDKEPDRIPRGKVERLMLQARGLADDLRTWVDLKVQLIELQIEERVKRLARQAAVSVGIAGIALVGLLFGLVAAALALGSWFGNNALGFLAVCGILLAVALLLYALRHRIVKGPVSSEPVQLPAPEAAPRLPEPEARASEAQSQSSEPVATPAP